MNNLKIALMAALILLLHFNAFAQLTVSSGQTATWYVQNVLVGTGITVSNVTSNMITTPPNIGEFQNGNSTNLGINNGIIMSTGSVLSAPGPNNSSSTTGATTGLSNDPQLNAIATSTVYDAAILEFDFIPLASPISFRYVFGSEEYNEYVNSIFNDVFGFFVSGPNPLGGNYSNVNIALVPGTTSPVSVNDVNDGNSSPGIPPSGPCNHCTYFIDNTNGLTIQYDAFTTVLTATINVVPCQTYHIKLAIADVGDDAYDSAVFLEANSFSSAAAISSTSFSNPAVQAAIRGCTQGIISFILPNLATSADTITYTISGTATNGVDYTTIPTSVIIPTGADSNGIVINPIYTGTPHGTETVTLIARTSPCTTDTITMNIVDPPAIVPSFSVQPANLCPGDTALITFTGTSNPGDLFTWNFAGGTIISGSGQGPYRVMWNAFGNFNVSLQIQGLCATVSYNAPVSYGPNPVPTSTSNSPVCHGLSLNLSAGGGAAYQWSGPNNFISNVQNPVISNVPTTNSGTYSVTVTNSYGCTAVSTSNVTINPSPSATAASNSPVCDGTTLLLNGGGGVSYVWSGPNSFSSSLQSPIITNSYPGQSGTYYVTVTSSNSCDSVVSTVVTVNALPTPVAGSNSPICTGDSLKLHVTGVSGVFLWSGPGGFTSTDQNPVLVNTNNTLNGLYSVTVTDANGCTMVGTTNVTVNTIYPAAGNNSPVCASANLNIVASGGVSYNWSGPGGFTSTQSNINIPQPSAGNSGVYTVTITDANGCFARMLTSVVVNPLPIPVSSNNSPICFGVDLHLSCSSASTYFWSGPSNFYSTLQNPVLTSANVNNSGLYNVVVSDINGCASVTSTTVTVNPLPVVSISNNTPVCIGQTVNITSSGGSSYSWTCSENGFSSSTQDLSFPDATVAESGHYTVTVTLNGCTSTATTDVIVNSFPLPTASSNSPVCYGYPLKLEATGGVHYQWSSSNGFSSASSQPLINLATDAASGMYYVTVTDINGCSSIASTLVYVSTKIILNTLDLTICSGNTANISAYAIGGTPPYTYYWNGYQSQATISVTPSENTSYNAQVLDTNGCKSNVSTLHIFVVPPVKIHAVSDKDTVCPGESVSIQINTMQGNGGPYLFYLSDGTVINSPYTTYPDGIHELIIFARDSCGAVDSDTLRIKVYPDPPMSFSPDKTSGCVPLNVFFNETSPATGQQYLWNFGEQSFNNTSFVQSPVHLYQYPGNYTVELTITSLNGCRTFYSYPDLITVYPLPGSEITSDKAGATILDGTINFINLSKIIDCKSYWSFGDNDSSDLRSPVHTFDSVGNFLVRLISVTPEGCTDTAFERIYIGDDFTFYAPTAFTPDNDGLNDYFYILGNGIDPDSFKMIIFDRWGEKIFETNQYDPVSPMKYGWDGMIKGKIKGEPGAYTWMVIYKDKQQIEHQKTGIVSLIR